MSATLQARATTLRERPRRGVSFVKWNRTLGIHVGIRLEMPEESWEMAEPLSSLTTGEQPLRKLHPDEFSNTTSMPQAW